MERSYRIEHVELGGLRALQGYVKFGPGLNLVLGPNNAGKTTLLEAILISFTLNFGDVAEDLGKILLLEAARGSEKHALYTLVDSKDAKPCISVTSQGESCTTVSRREGLESRGLKVTSVVSLDITSSKRDCVATLDLREGSIGIGVRGKECRDKVFHLSIIPSGIMPYNMFDALVGYLKRARSSSLEKLIVKLGNTTYKVDVAADPWNSIVSVIYEKGRETPVMFYGLGRGLQRVFQILVALEVSDIVLIDEIESAMHPELLAFLVNKIAEAVDKGKQLIVTTQSQEAATMLISALISRKPSADRAALLEAIDRCEVNDKLAIITLAKEENNIRSLTLKGCTAVHQVATSTDPRLSYILITPPREG